MPELFPIQALAAAVTELHKLTFQGGSALRTEIKACVRKYHLEGMLTMKLKKHGAFLVNFVIGFANGDISRRDFDMDYSGYVIEHFPEFEEEHPRLSQKFASTIDRTYSACSWMPDNRFREAISNALDEFLGISPQSGYLLILDTGL